MSEKVKEMIKFIAKIKLFFINLYIVLNGGIAYPRTWREKRALEKIAGLRKVRKK